MDKDLESTGETYGCLDCGHLWTHEDDACPNCGSHDFETLEDKFIEWLEFQFSFEIHNVSKMAIKTKLQQYAQQASKENEKKISLLFTEWILKKVDDESWFDEWQKQK